MERLTAVQRRALGATLKHKRAGLGWTQAELAKQARLARAYIAHIETGSKAPSVAVLTRYCRAMGVNPSDVLIESGLAPPRDEGVHPLLLESLRRMDYNVQSKLVAAWPHLERFLTSCLSQDGPEDDPRDLGSPPA